MAGLGTDDPPDDDAPDPTASSSAAGAASDPPPPSVLGHYERLGPPNAAGHVTEDGKLVVRIQRPASGRIWIHCYRHTACRLNVKAVDGPTDAQIYYWAFCQPACSSEALYRKQLAAAHMDAGRELWSAKRRTNPRQVQTVFVFT